jgi:hypothetical protein
MMRKRLKTAHYNFSFAPLHSCPIATLREKIRILSAFQTLISMNRSIKYLGGLSLLCLAVTWTSAQNRELKFNFNEDGSHYLKATLTGQVWLRYNESNPGSTLNGFSTPQTYDIGLRRVRSQVFGQVTDKVFFYTQLGINNYSYHSNRKPGIFFHDVVTEYHVTPRALHIGTGLTGWTGFTRYSSPSVATSLAHDAPIYQQATNDANDQFLRKLSVYAKGKLGRIDYRLIVSKPMLVDEAIPGVKPININSDFSYLPPKMQSSGYVMYQFLDEETNRTPYMTGTYLGQKRVFNIGAGFQYQPDAMWRYGSAALLDTIKSDLLNVAVDVFFDRPTGSKGAAITAYAAASRTDYGKNYVRNGSPMNPASSSSGTSFNGGGSAFPMFGTGNVFFGQLGYLLPKPFLGEKRGQLQPYGDITLARYERLNDPMLMWNTGVNWLLDGHRSRISLNYQNRPVFGSADLKEISRKSMVVLQFQVAI